MSHYSWKDIGIAPTSTKSNQSYQRFPNKNIQLTSNNQIKFNTINQRFQKEKHYSFFSRYLSNNISKRSINFNLSNSPSIKKVQKSSINNEINVSIISQVNGVDQKLIRSPRLQLQSPQKTDLSYSPVYKGSKQVQVKHIESKMANRIRREMMKVKKIKEQTVEVKNSISKDLLIFLIEMKKAIKQTEFKASQIINKKSNIITQNEENNSIVTNQNNPETSIQSHLTIQSFSPIKKSSGGLNNNILQRIQHYSNNFKQLQKAKQMLLTKLNHQN